MVLVFNCIHCEIEFSIDDQYLGSEVSCPDCTEGNILPTADEYYGAETVLGMDPIDDNTEAAPEPQAPSLHGQTKSGLPDFFTDAEWSQLASTDRAVYNAVYDWSTRETWQFAFLAAMIRSRLTRLRAHVAEPLSYTRTISLFRSRTKVSAMMTKNADRMLYMSSNLNQQLGTYLWYTLFQTSLEPTYDLFGRLDPWIEKLTDFHDDLTEMPEFSDDCSAEMQDCMSRWVPWIWQSLDRLADRLDHDSHTPQTHDSRIRPQISTQPPSLHDFFIAHAKLIS